MNDLPAPLVPPEVDLRGLEYMPLFGNHLFGSEFNAAATDAEWRAALTLWWAAWNQVPAGSLPSDDTALCRLADLGRDLKTWKRLRARAVHGFVLCSDGRLYHEFLCRQALVAWDKRVKERERKANWRKNKGGDATGRDADVPRDTPPNGRGPGRGHDTGQRQGRDADVPADGNRRDVTGIEIPPAPPSPQPKPPATHPPPAGAAGPSASLPAQEPTAPPSPYGAIAGALRRAGIPDASPTPLRFRALVDAGATAEEFLHFAASALKTGDRPFAYLLGAVEGERKRAALTAGQLHHGPMQGTESPVNKGTGALQELRRNAAELSTPEARARSEAARKAAMAQVGLVAKRMTAA